MSQFAPSTPPPSNPKPSEPIDPEPSGLSWKQANALGRQIIWSILAFCIGLMPGGLIASLFVNLGLSILGSAANEDLTVSPDWVRLRIGFVVLGMILGGLMGIVVSLPQESEKARLSRQSEAEKAEKLQAPADAGLTANLLQSFRFGGFLFSDTIRLLLPSTVVSTKRSDDTYISETSKTFKELLNGKAKNLEGQEEVIVKIDETQKDIILKNWLPQIEWTNNRANRERDANELISWWQLIIAALIPFVATLNTVFGLQGSTVVALLGIFVTVLTGLIRFRRPEERWKHYRRLTEDYQRELWNFVSLNDSYKGLTHEEAFNTFNGKMTILRENDVRVFLGEVANSTSTSGEIKQYMDQNYPTPPAAKPAAATPVTSETSGSG